MTAADVTGWLERHASARVDFDAKYRRCEAHNRARYWCGCYYHDRTAALGAEVTGR